MWTVFEAIHQLVSRIHVQAVNNGTDSPQVVQGDCQTNNRLSGLNPKAPKMLLNSFRQSMTTSPPSLPAKALSLLHSPPDPHLAVHHTRPFKISKQVIQLNVALAISLHHTMEARDTGA